MRPGIVFASLAWLVLGTPAIAQVGPEAFVLLHFFGAPKETCVRLRGMGGAAAGVPDALSPNPAFLAWDGEGLVSLKQGAFSHEDVERTTASQTHLVLTIPVGRSRDRAWSFNYCRVDTGTEDTLAFLPLLATKRMQEEDIALSYGDRVSPQWAWGVTVASMATDIRYRAQPTGTELASIESKLLRGVRLGAAYAASASTTAGLVLDLYEERSELTSPLLGDASGTFRTRDLYLGVSHSLPGNALLAVQYEKCRFAGTGTAGTSFNEWRIGAEMPVGSWDLRGGLMDWEWSAGLGYSSGSWRFDYAYQRNPHDDCVGYVFGDSNVHSLQATWMF